MDSIMLDWYRGKIPRGISAKLFVAFIFSKIQTTLLIIRLQNCLNAKLSLKNYASSSSGIRSIISPG